MNRRFNPPEEGLPDFFAGVGLHFKAMAQATSIDDVFARLEADRVTLQPLFWGHACYPAAFR